MEQAHRFGTVATDADGRITEFVEKSPSPRSRLASMGIYMFNRTVLATRLTEDARKMDSSHDFGYAILPAMVGRDKVFAHRFDAYWQDIGTVEAYYQANMELLRAEPPLSLAGGIPLMTERRAHSAQRTGPTGRVVNSLVGPGCLIDGYVENSVLAPGVRVAEKAEVRDSLVMANVSVGYHSIVSRSVLDEGVRVGKFCFVGFGVGRPAASGEITLLGKGVELPAATAVGRSCKIMPDVGPEAFVGRLVPSGSTVFGAATGS
jgi:glucose-1-phosphate adenylyltransferase